jgi:DNA-binding transcriptional MerR regulator
MKNAERALGTIEELSARVAEALSVDYEGVPSSRVRDVPDLRTIRYYTTLGLLDRPAAMRGRTALYGSRHVLQLVAIKRLQAHGLSLAAVQDRMLGASDGVLRRIAAAPGLKRRRVEPPGLKPDLEPAASRGDSFWCLPAKASDDIAVDNGFPRSPDHPENAEILRQVARAEFQTTALGDGLLLSFTSRRDVDEEDLRSIRTAAASLIEVLKLRGLIDK